MTKKFWMMVAAILVLGSMTGCPDEDDCASDPSLCDPDSDTDTDAGTDADSDVPVQYGSLTVTSTPVSGATIELNGEPSGQVTDYTFSSLVTGAHSVLLSLAGRLQVSDTGEFYQPTEVNVTQDGMNVNIVLYWDVTGSWHNADTSAPVTLEMKNRDQILAFPPTDACPDTVVIIHGLEALGAVCVEADETLSLCKNSASNCGGRQRVNGQIANDGNQIEFTFWPMDGGPSEHYTYVKD